MHRVTACAKQCADPQLAAIISAAGAAALAAGALLRDLYGKPHQINHKGAIDLVTEADVAAEQAIIAHLRAAFPDVGFLAEESSAPPTSMPTTPCWIIDPLDGTTNFAHHFPWFATSIGYAEDGEIKAGAIYQPLLDELFLAGRGCGAWLNQKRIRVSETAELRQSLLATGFPYNIKEKIDEVMHVLTAILPLTQGVRRAGAAAVDMAYVACGRLDGFWEINLKPWDTAAGLLLIEEAGGRVSDFRGNPFSPIDNEILVSNATLHGQLTGILADIAPHQVPPNRA